MQATVTAKTGPARQVTSLVLTNVKKMELDLVGKIVRFDCDQGIREFDLVSVATLTDTITSGDHVIVVSE